jgi:hypothetical protein
MQINLQITYADGAEKTVKAIAADLVAFESEYDISIQRLEQNLKLTHLLFLAWNAEKRTRQTALEFLPWVETVESVTPVETKK